MNTLCTYYVATIRSKLMYITQNGLMYRSVHLSEDLITKLVEMNLFDEITANKIEVLLRPGKLYVEEDSDEMMTLKMANLICCEL